MEDRRVISVLVENKPGVLARISGMFSGRGFNIHSLAVAPTSDPQYSQMTIVTGGNEQVIEQIIKQLRKLINVVKVQDLTRGDYVDREMVLVRIKSAASDRSQVLAAADIFRGKIIDVGHDSVTVEVTGAQNKIDAFLQILAPMGIIELIRTGMVAIPRARKEPKPKGNSR
ncbi:MAG: acetolactate synthase small subunit [Desulfomonilaceae bacterium]